MKYRKKKYFEETLEDMIETGAEFALVVYPTESDRIAVQIRNSGNELSTYIAAKTLLNTLMEEDLTMIDMILDELDENLDELLKGLN